ncbi:exo-rhamnogalacturonan lyase family protein [Neobacillus sp. Marseille-QA0830]
MTSHIKLKWLDHQSSGRKGVTWGVPWKRGVLSRQDQLVLVNEQGKPQPIQTWPTAFWPDGSVKWTAHAASFDGKVEDQYKMKLGKSEYSDGTLTVKESEEYIEIDTGSIVCQLNKRGNTIIKQITRENRVICTGSQLNLIREERSQTTGYRIKKEEDFVSHISRAAVEQDGPIRCTVKVEGRHERVNGGRLWIPFTLRFYFYVNQASIKINHTFVYDGNPHEDYIKGLGMSFSVPMKGPLYNRHVRLVGDTGLFSESPKNLATMRTVGKYEELFKKQQSGAFITFDENQDEKFLDILDDAAVWDRFKLVQQSADSYCLSKQTKTGCSWLHAAAGHRAGGTIYVGSENGGMATGVRNFWKRYPSSLEVSGTAEDTAELKAWFWSPDGETMDLRHYDTETHLKSSYEGFEEMRSTPYGIANTSELVIHCFDRTPSHGELLQWNRDKENPALFVCEPQYYHEVKAFGEWSLEDRRTPALQEIEEKLDQTIDFYQKEVEQRRWYGFWNYGDVMHTYDHVRHTWRYDIGGYAWQNTELVPNMWLWYMFLRSGKSDIFRMAEAMTRHTSEVDVYHMGEYAGLGSRHNVIHWGCGCKEARIAMAGLHRFYYYLTADERIGDIMDEVVNADYTTVNLDPMRAYFPKDNYPTHTRIGPDWAAFVSNWMTRWERYEDTEYRDKILTGIDCLKKMPLKMKALAAYGYDPKTGKIYDIGNFAGGHLAICMGEPQVWFELTPLIDDPEWEEMLIEIGEFYNLPWEEKVRSTSVEFRKGSYAWPMFSTGITAYAAMKKNNTELSEVAWSILLNDKVGKSSINEETLLVKEDEVIRPIHELPWVTTNTVSQWSINAIMCIGFIGDALVQKETVKQVESFPKGV